MEILYNMEKPDDIKLKQLEERYRNIENDIKDLNEQLNYTENAASRNNIERQINFHYKKLEKIEQEIKKLKSATPSTKINTDFTKKPIPPLLPHLCNRTEQKSQIEDAYNQFKKQNSYRCLVFIIHGDDKQCHRFFLKRMQKYILPQSLESMPYTFREYFLEWPAKLKTTNNLRSRLLKQIKENFFKNVDVAEDKIRDYFIKSSNELIFHTYLTTKNWQEQGFTILDKFLDFWQSLYNENLIEKEIIICVFIEYRNDGKKSNIIEWIKSILSFKNNHRTNRKIRNHLKDLLKAKRFNDRFNDLLIIPVVELESITIDDVHNWTNYDEVQDFVDESKLNQLTKKINQIFHDWKRQNPSESIPMMELQDYLLNLLEELT